MKGDTLPAVYIRLVRAHVLGRGEYDVFDPNPPGRIQCRNLSESFAQNCSEPLIHWIIITTQSLDETVISYLFMAFLGRATRHLCNLIRRVICLDRYLRSLDRHDSVVHCIPWSRTATSNGTTAGYLETLRGAIGILE